jgi:BlaI family transcriptional regulator, penicillinase repressor
MTKSKLLPLAEGQLEIMEIVWERGEVTVAEVWKALAARRKVARNTVQTMLQRLTEQGWLRIETDSHAHRYRAAAPRAATLKNILKRFVDVVFDGSTEGLLATLLHGRKVLPAEAARIRALIDQAEDKRP